MSTQQIMAEPKLSSCPILLTCGVTDACVSAVRTTGQRALPNAISSYFSGKHRERERENDIPLSVFKMHGPRRYSYLHSSGTTSAIIIEKSTRKQIEVRQTVSSTV